MKKTTKDVGASVRARLLQLARERTEDFQLVLTRYANERLLYRLSRSRHSGRFVLKGATLFTLWTGQPHRATRDVDLLGYGDPSSDVLRDVFAEVLSLKVEDDGIRFDIDSLSAGVIREEQEYGGVRISLAARVTTAKVRLQIDVGFGDAITPEPVVVGLPVMLDYPAPQLRTYPRETVVAEKLEAMVSLGMANSRMKDFYDLVIISQMFTFDGQTLTRAIGATFQRRGTPLPTGIPVALTPEFASDRSKNIQWQAFVTKSGAPSLGDLSSVAAKIEVFAQAPLNAAARASIFRAHWSPEQGWLPSPEEP